MKWRTRERIKKKHIPQHQHESIFHPHTKFRPQASRFLVDYNRS